jgi:hypothetical protein
MQQTKLSQGAFKAMLTPSHTNSNQLQAPGNNKLQSASHRPHLEQLHHLISATGTAMRQLQL